MAFSPSTWYQAYARRLRIPFFTGPKGSGIIGAFFKVLGDLTLDWGTQANLEHLPEYASPQSVGLTAGERQLDANPQESTAALATRTTQATLLWRYAGTPLGMLLALHYAGFDGAVIVTQNGLGFQLSLPLPPIVPGQDWQPQTSLVVTNLDSNPNYSASWWTFDNQDSFCSRFAVLFPNGTGPTTTYGRAVFNNTDTATVSWNNPSAFSDTTYTVYAGMPVVTDNPTLGVSIWHDASGKTTTSTIIRASDAFAGYVDVLAAPSVANPYAWMTTADAQRLQSVIAKWRPAKASCTGVFVLAQGRFIGWPVGNSDLGSPGQVVMFPGA
jgi:hypothetical protein